MGDCQTRVYLRPIFVTNNVIYINGSSRVHREYNANRKDRQVNNHENCKM